VGLAQAQLRSFIEFNDVTLLNKMAATVEQLKELDATNPLLNYLQGELKHNQGEYADAATLFAATIQQQRYFSKAYTGLSKAYLQLRDFKKSENTLINAYELMPNNNAILAGLGEFYYREGNYKRAIEKFTLLATKTPDNYTAHLNLSACYYLSGDMKEALSSAKKALSIQSNFIVFSNLGTLYFLLNDFTKSVEAYEKMIELNDTDYLNWGNLADAYRFSKNKKYMNAFLQAINLAEKAIELNPRDKYAIASLAYYHANLSNIEKTHMYAKQVSEEDSGEDLFFVAAAYTRLNMKQAAFKYLKLAINNKYSVAEIKASPLLKSLKNEPRFNKIIAEEK